MQIKDLFEAPIDNFELIGNWDKNSSYRNETDRKMLSSPKIVELIKTKWQKTRVPFNMFFVNNPEGGRNREVGEVSRKWLEEKMPKTFAAINQGEWGLRDGAINILYTNNSGAERVPMTAWILAHRFGHALRNGMWGTGPRYWREALKDLDNVSDYILQNAYGYKLMTTRNKFSSIISIDDRNDKILKQLYTAIGTMRSARTNKLRNRFEFLYELLAQYLMTGKIKFNSLPKFIRNTKSGGYYPFQGTEGDIEIYDSDLETLAQNLCDDFENLLYECVGKIFVM